LFFEHQPTSEKGRPVGAVGRRAANNACITEGKKSGPISKELKLNNQAQSSGGYKGPKERGKRYVVITKARKAAGDREIDCYIAYKKGIRQLAPRRKTGQSRRVADKKS